MLNPLRKVSRFGNTFEVITFEKPLIRPHRQGHTVIRRKKNSSLRHLKAKKNIWRAKRNIRRHISVATYKLGMPAFATFTYAKPQMDMDSAIADWRNFTRTMKRHYPQVAFIRVPERHKSGAIHFHAIMYGLPEQLPCLTKLSRHGYIHACPPTRQCERKLRSLATVWGLGFVDLNVVKKPDAIGVYVAKYLTKGDPDWSLFGNHIASSNSVMLTTLKEARSDGVYYEMSSYKTPYGVAEAIDSMPINCELIRESTFTTLWLGDAKFQSFRLRPPDS